MKRALLALMLGATLCVPQAQAANPSLDVEGECRSISEADLSGCRCRGLYFENRLGSEEGAVALHLVGRSYVPEPRISAATLYKRFGADKLNEVARRILAMHDDAISYCPFSTHVAE